ncbi:hypothetical protein PSHT_06174 [Puccinia striiformis]|uniref:Uncharacterized protein n=2 Tax=Puccinia striiformis TaxID=27350 RepID=A0A2S4W8L8_9BASI|nr:hypothetical protein PSHT_06174 [Puccinia striiformis]
MRILAASTNTNTSRHWFAVIDGIAHSTREGNNPALNNYTSRLALFFIGPETRHEYNWTEYAQLVAHLALRHDYGVTSEKTKPTLLNAATDAHCIRRRPGYILDELRLAEVSGAFLISCSVTVGYCLPLYQHSSRFNHLRGDQVPRKAPWRCKLTRRNGLSKAGSFVKINPNACHNQEEIHRAEPMSDSNEIEALEAPKFSSSEVRQHRQRGDLVIRGFRSLISRFDPDEEACYSRKAKGEGLDFAEPDLKKHLINQLRSSFLPLLRQQIAKLSQLLDLTELRNKPGLTLKLILDLQSELLPNLNQIEDALCELRSELGGSSPPKRINDQYLKEIKYFRTTGMNEDFEELIVEYIKIFKESCRLLLELKLSKRKPNDSSSEESDPQTVALTRQRIIDHTSCFSEAFEMVIRWFKETEFDLIQSEWPRSILGIDDQLEALLKLIDPRTESPKEPQLNELTGLLESTFISERIMPLAKRALPIIKLCGLFFKKLSQRGMNQKRLPMFTEMRSDQLERLADLSEVVHCDLKGLIRLFRADHATNDFVQGIQFSSIVDKLEGHFELTSLLVPFYLVPLIPDTDGFPVQDHYRTWFVTWCSQFSLSIQNFKDAIEAFEDSASSDHFRQAFPNNYTRT